MLRNNFDRLNSGEKRVSLRCSCKGGSIERNTYVNGSSVHCENMVTMMLFTTSSFVLSVAVISIKTFRVFSVIFEWSPLMIGGKEQTVLFES